MMNVCRSQARAGIKVRSPIWHVKCSIRRSLGPDQVMNITSSALAADMRQPRAEAERPAAVPARQTLDAQLHDQRLRLVSIYCFGLAIVAALWSVAYLSYAVGGTASLGLVVLVLVHVLGLGAAGVIGAILCRRDRLRDAT